MENNLLNQPNNTEEQDTAFIPDDKSPLGSKIVPTPKPEKNIGIDIHGQFFDNIINAGEASALDISKFNSFLNISQSRDQVYSLLDAMGNDTTVAAILETYAEDVTEYNDQGRIVWAESADGNIAKYVTFLLDTMNVDKHIYNWVYSLCKYGDLYLRLYRESEYNSDPIFGNESDTEKQLNKLKHKDRETLNEDVIIKAYKDSDKFTHYVEAVANPAEMFELTKFGKTAGYIKADIGVSQQQQQTNTIGGSYYQYSFDKRDVEVYAATEFVHACLDDNSSRTPEEVELFTTKDATGKATDSYKYRVKRGQALLYNVFKVWRELMLLENSVLLNRVTKSSIVRVVGVEVGEMPKEMVGPHLQGIKSLIEQKVALNNGDYMNEYTNPGPVENNIYVPTHNGQGAITTQQIGGDVDVKSLADLDYFNNKFFGGARVPKQFFCLRGDTKILLLDGTEHTIKDMYDNASEFIGKGIMGVGVDGSLDPTTIKNIMLTRKDAQFIRVWLDNDEYVDCTPEHRFMLRTGELIEAKDLQVNDSLMPYYDKIVKGRRYVLDNKDGKFKPQYRVVKESVEEVPQEYQVHHIDRNKMNDDFTNLVTLSLEEHYREHEPELRYYNKKSENKANTNSIWVTNGIWNERVQEGQPIPEGFERGFTRTTSEESRLAVSNSMKKRWETGAITHEASIRNRTKEQMSEWAKKAYITKSANKELMERLSKAQSELCKKMGFGKMGVEARLKNIPQNRRKLDRYFRCPCCGNIFIRKMNEDDYNKYLANDMFVYDTKECVNFGGRGKLPRSHKLFIQASGDKDTYEKLCEETRRDLYFKYENMIEKEKILKDYTPLVNHKVTKIEVLPIIEDAYDIEVASDNHMFALPAGIFVHNCQTDDSTGFNGGTSLTIISSRYAKMVKRIQNTMVQALTDAINIMLIDKGLSSYVNQFQLHMLTPATQEEIDRHNSIASEMSILTDTMNNLSDIENTATKLKIAKSMLSNIITNTEVIDLLQEEIDKMETEEEPMSEMDDIADIENESDFNEIPRSSGSNDFITADVEQEIPEEGEEGEEVLSQATLPTPSELDLDLTDNNVEI